MKINLLIVALFFLTTISLYSQNPPDTLWTKTFGGNEVERGTCVQQTTDGGYIITGYTGSYGSGSLDVWLIKTDANGNETWNQTFGGYSSDIGSSVQQTIDGGYIIVGNTYSFGTGDTDIWLIKTNSNGSEMWNQTFGGVQSDYASTVLQTTDGGYIIAGSTDNFGSGDRDVWLIKTDNFGNETWNQTFGGTLSDAANSLVKTEDDGYIIAGSTESFGAGASDIWLIKTDINGNEIWNQTYGGTLADMACSVQLTADGGYILSGMTSSLGDEDGDAWLIKTDGNGNEIWNQAYGGNLTEYAQSILKTSDGGYLFAGYTYSFGAGASDVWVVKTDSNGNEIWNQTIGYELGDMAFSIQSTSDNGYVLTGHTASFGNPDDDIWLLKLNSEFYANFSAFPLSGYSPLNVDYLDESLGNITIWEWDFNNDGIIDSYVQNPIFTYNQPGIYSVALTISDGTNEDTIIKEDYIIVLEPIIADFIGAPLNGSNPLEVNFTDLSTGVPTTWLWDFDNDGFIDSNEQNPIYIYNNIGVYSVSLTVSDSNSEDTKIKENYITVNSVSGDNNLLPVTTRLFSNHPNPFNPITTISFEIKEGETGILTIFNLRGQLIESNEFNSGNHDYIWNADKHGSGLYFYQLKTESSIHTKKMLLLK